MNRIGRSLGVSAVLLSAAGLFAGCGGGDDDGSPGGGGSFTNIRSAIESPTGTVDATSAQEVGVEFEKVASVSSASGARRDAQTAQVSQDSACPAGGSIDASGSNSQASGEASIAYNDCCVTAGCCVDGTAHFFFSSEQGSAFTSCGSYDLSYDCDGNSASLEYEGCLSSTGQQIYVIEVDGDTYSVSGNYSNGSGSLEIRGANGTWTCTYTSGGGSCSGSAGSFEF